MKLECKQHRWEWAHNVPWPWRSPLGAQRMRLGVYLCRCGVSKYGEPSEPVRMVVPAQGVAK